jgi:hypothetical protein
LNAVVNSRVENCFRGRRETVRHRLAGNVRGALKFTFFRALAGAADWTLGVVPY